MSILDNEGHDPNGLGNRPTRTEVDEMRAEIGRLRAALEIISGFGAVPLTQEWPDGLRGIIRAMTDCARNALEQEAPK